MFYLIQLLNAVQYGLLLFLLSSGLTLIFGIMGVINLAHGSFYMVGAYLAFWLAKLTGSLWLALPLAVVIAFAVGLLLETAIFSRLYRRDHLYQVLLTFGLILIFEELRSILFGDDVHGVAVPALLDFSIPLTDTLSYPVYRLFVTLVCLVIAGLMYFVIHRTRIGMMHSRRQQQSRDGGSRSASICRCCSPWSSPPAWRSPPSPARSPRRSPRCFPAWAIRS